MRICNRKLQRRAVILLAVFLLGVLVVVLHTSTESQSEPKFSNELVTVVINQSASFTTSTFSGRLITSGDQLPSLYTNSFPCVTAKTSGMSFPICVYKAAEDLWVSQEFLKGGYFEGGTVKRILRLLRRYPDIEFVDLGANIGTFTLPASRITHVVAVEPYSKTMVRLFKSVKLGEVEKNVSLVFNAISNEQSLYMLGFHPRNLGGTYLKTDRSIKCTGGSDCGSPHSVTETILLNDLLPLMRGRRAVLKVDVEGHQHQVFTEATAGKFFEFIDVPLIYMEWSNLCQIRSIISEVQDLLKFFSDRKYNVFSDKNRELGGNCTNWPPDIVFKKSLIEF